MGSDYTVTLTVTANGDTSTEQQVVSVSDTGGTTPDCTAPTERCDRPVPIGVSSGNINDREIQFPFIVCFGGTLGARATNGTNVFALSNNHVYANENQHPLGSDIVQPGLLDNNCAQESTDIIAQLSAFKTLVFDAAACDPEVGAADPDCNTIDAAIAVTTTALVDNATPPDGYGTPSSTTIAATVGLGVQKYGRTTGLTTGSVTGINATVDVGYDSGTARFVDQIIFDDISDGGDSGSLIVINDVNKNPVALLFAGNGNSTVGNPIDLVLTEFGVTIDGETGPPPQTTATPIPGDAPVVDACNPNNASNGDQLIVAVTGSNFQSSAAVDFGERVMVQGVAFVGSTQLDVQIKVHPKATSGPRDVMVTNPGGGNDTNAGCFTVN